jgi:hypothetical protein
MIDERQAIDDLMRRFFGAVSFAAGGRPAYGVLHELFIPRGLLINCNPPEPEALRVDEFIAPRQRRVDEGALTAFEEQELDSTTDVLGNVAHRLSTYRKRGTSGGVSDEGRGAIFTQFVRTPDGWRISAMAWDDERPGFTPP